MRLLHQALAATLPSLVLASNDQTPLITAKTSTIPLIGFGTWNLKVSPENTTKAVSLAIQAGYKHIDCAAAYDNQRDVGRGIKEGLLAMDMRREEIWVTSKLWNDHHAPDKVEEGLNETLKELGLDYLDLYLMHWPVGNSPKTGKLEEDYVETWHAMERLLPLGTVRHIGVSNFSPHQLHELVTSSRHKPAVHQMELHPYLQQTDWVQYHQTHGIAVTAYSPLANTNPTYDASSSSSDSSSSSSTSSDPPPLLHNRALLSIAQRRNCTAAQVALAWGMQRGTNVIPKSSHAAWIRENVGATGCALALVDVEEIAEVGRRELKRFNNPSGGWGVRLFVGGEEVGLTERKAI